MAGIGGSQNAEMQAGISHLTNPGKSNESPLGPTGSLQADSDRWNSLTPHGVVNTATGASSQDDSSWERLQRGQGSYSPGSMTQMQDQLGNGNDDIS